MTQSDMPLHEERTFRLSLMRLLLELGVRVLVSLVIAFVLAFLVEFIFRGSFSTTATFFVESYRPGWSTVAIYTVSMLALDAVLGRRHEGILILAPVVLGLAWAAHQKSLYLGDPLYPSDLLFARQIVDLLPLLVGERPVYAALIVLGGVAAAVAGVTVWRRRKRLFPVIGWRARLSHLGVTIPILGLLAVSMDTSNYSWTRDRLWISPMMWDQTANYDYNGFTAAFLMNIPMAKVAAPAGYTEAALKAMKPSTVVQVPATRPDIVMVMSESFWDPTRLPGVRFSSDPIPTARQNLSGHVFSPEFGGMTANVEFEALTGFSNAFLPFGGIPYQQYVRRDLPSLASFFAAEGYVTRAMHPFRGGFWNRTSVYDALGFQSFRSEENLSGLQKRGGQVSDAAFGEEIIREADSISAPFFLFGVSIQGHGPYPAGRYPDAMMRVSADAGAQTAGSIRTYAEGAHDADRMLAQLMEWAKGRDRETIIVYFGDHLPPLGAAYVETGFLTDVVAPRAGPADQMKRHRETPLVVWSNRTGAVKGLGTVSPSFLPYHILKLAGYSHPYYTGALGRLHDRYDVVDRYLLIESDGEAIADWQRRGAGKAAIDATRLLQYDILFGKRHAAQRYFPNRPGPPAPQSVEVQSWGGKPGAGRAVTR